MVDDDANEDMTVVPLPSSETEDEHRRVRSSNDRDQADEQQHRRNRHNAGYDESADGPSTPDIERVVDE